MEVFEVDGASYNLARSGVGDETKGASYEFIA